MNGFRFFVVFLVVKFGNCYGKITQNPITSTKSHQQCCTAEITSPYLYTDKNEEDCANQTFGQQNYTNYYDRPFEEQVWILKNQTYCFMQCMAQKCNLAESDMVAQERLEWYLSTIYPLNWMKPFSKEISTRCMDEVYEEMTDYLNNITTFACNPAFNTLYSCICIEFERHCPDEFIKYGEECNDIN